MTLDCEPSPLFRPQEYALPDSLVPLVRMVTGRETIIIIPFMLHSLSMSVFSSVIGPFGGFFASGFKRAFKIKVRFSKSIKSVHRNSLLICIRILETSFQATVELWTVSTAST